MDKGGLHNKYLIRSFIFKFHELGELWNASGENLYLLRTWQSWNMQTDLPIENALTL